MGPAVIEREIIDSIEPRIWFAAKGTVGWLLLFMVASLMQCQLPQKPETASGAILFSQYCGSCHLAPQPTDLPVSVWKKRVLPEMAARMGLLIDHYNPYAGLNMEETFYTQISMAYPPKPIITRTEWDSIANYVLSHAVDTFLFDSSRLQRNKPINQFAAHPVKLDDLPESFVSYIHHDEHAGTNFVGFVRGQVYAVPDPEHHDFIEKRYYTIADYRQRGDTTWCTEMGPILPSEIPKGRLSKTVDSTLVVVADSLHRPVYTVFSDLDGDGKDEILLAEFGNKTGELLLLHADQDGGYLHLPLLAQPGIIRIIVQDMNQDLKPDLVVLASQGNEGVYLLLNQGNLKFTTQQVIRLPSVYGSSWIELVDMDHDKDLDIVLANGDNADYSYALKPYHGVRIFTNNGNNEFEQQWFYPIYGATRVIARDFDLDGDVDLLVNAYFANYDQFPEESIVYLQNDSDPEFMFSPFTFPDAAKSGRWLISECADYDQDGDLDVILGSNIWSPAPTGRDVLNAWRKAGIDLLFLENKLR